MGILSNSTSITRYRVQGAFEGPITEAVEKGLQKHIITDIDSQAQEKSVGWTAFSRPFLPDFSGSAFTIGTFFVFALRIDKKTVSSKIVKKHFEMAMDKKLTDTGRDFLSRNEKKILKEQVTNVLIQRLPATPNVVDVIWHYENRDLWFFSTQKAANEELETLFYQSFKHHITRVFPYTLAHQLTGLDKGQQDALNKATPSLFSG
jgi:recombination associated protein RdgC